MTLETLSELDILNQVPKMSSVLAHFKEGRGVIPKQEKVNLIVPQEQLEGAAWHRGKVLRSRVID